MSSEPAEHICTSTPNMPHVEAGHDFASCIILSFCGEFFREHYRVYRWHVIEVVSVAAAVTNVFHERP